MTRTVIFRKGELVDVTIPGAYVVADVEELTGREVLRVAYGPLTLPVHVRLGDVDVVRRVPVHGPARPGDVYECPSGFEFFAVEYAPDFTDPLDEQDTAGVDEHGRRVVLLPAGTDGTIPLGSEYHRAEVVHHRVGGLSLVRRRGWTPPPSLEEDDGDAVDGAATHRTGQAAATSLRALADALDALGPTAMADFHLDVSMHVARVPHGTERGRADTVERLAGALGMSVVSGYVDDVDGGLHVSNREDRSFMGMTVAIFATGVELQADPAAVPGVDDVEQDRPVAYWPLSWRDGLPDDTADPAAAPEAAEAEPAGPPVAGIRRGAGAIVPVGGHAPEHVRIATGGLIAWPTGRALLVGEQGPEDAVPVDGGGR